MAPKSLRSVDLSCNCERQIQSGDLVRAARLLHMLNKSTRCILAHRAVRSSPVGPAVMFEKKESNRICV
ncbi:hypothetical protein ATANTOWER_026831 [Ataeniobius toweri]|uniref:Uncharacterized protein n=1 Tax=Ataeniobius toweri TaxID=208326 RepID=A0ABU7B3E0_9TELE|nr:hypothetical protein [Ataeniobius toweri]